VAGAGAAARGRDALRKGKQIEAEFRNAITESDAPVSPGMPPVHADSAQALAFREAQAELRKTSRLGALNAG